MLTSLLKPLTVRAGRQLAERLFETDGATFGEALRRASQRQNREGGSSSDRPR